jgi:UrcA family protein
VRFTAIVGVSSFECDGSTPPARQPKETTMNTVPSADGFSRLLVSTVCAVIVAGFAAGAAVADDGTVRKVTVRYGDLDLSSPRGAAALYHRIGIAAEEVCWPFEGRDLAGAFHFRACKQRAIADAVSRVNRPELFTVYNANNRAPLRAAAITAHRTAP